MTAWAQVQEWLDAPSSWVPLPTERHAEVFGRFLVDHRVTGALVPDAELAALAFEHGLAVASTDSDFSRFTAVRWVDPLLHAPIIASGWSPSTWFFG